MSDKVYVLHPGEIISKEDGDIYYITAARLATLYGLDWRRCLVFNENNRGYKDNPNHIHLYPRYDGDYTIKSK